MKKLHEFLEEILEHKIGDIVYLKTDREQLDRMIYGYTIFPTHIVYNLAQGEQTSGHFNFELTSEKNIY